MPFVEPSKTPIEALQQPVNPFKPRSGLILFLREAHAELAAAVAALRAKNRAKAPLKQRLGGSFKSRMDEFAFFLL